MTAWSSGTSWKHGGDLLERPEPMQHPKVRQRDADLEFVTVILIIPIGCREADSGGVLASKTFPGLSFDRDGPG